MPPCRWRQHWVGAVVMTSANIVERSGGLFRRPSRRRDELVALEMSRAREPCSERKFQSHPTVPPGRLNELAFAAVYREWGVRCELLWGVEPHDIPNGEQQGSRMR
jgi:hypothetical protein